MWRSLSFILVFRGQWVVYLPDLLIFDISYLGLSNTNCWRAFIYVYMWVVVALAGLSAQMTRRLGRCKVVGYFVIVVFLFCVVYPPPCFLIKCYWLQSFGMNCGAWANLKCKPDFHVHVLLSSLSLLYFLCYRQNTLGHAGLAYFMQELSKPLSRGTKG